MRNIPLFFVISVAVLAATHTDAAERNTRQPFELLDGDRVVMIGGTFIEREQRESYIETALTAHYPDRNITFRNLGWSGDTVRAESRGIFDPPEVGYQRLMEQVTELKPTVVMLFYGNNESFAGDKGLPQFEHDYRKLLDDLSVAASNPVFVLVSPHRHMKAGNALPDPTKNNQHLKMYSLAIERLAHERDSTFVDMYKPLTSGEWIESENGIHLTPTGYSRASIVFCERLLGPKSHGDISEDLRLAVIEKNRLYFYRWRPQNVTYLFGFRKHEQGNNAVEVPQFDPLIEEMEAKIAELRRVGGDTK
ncbi:MAG: SGNH/GDSL hydrolase family protein [Planctomycetota bacterium]|nr:SGNH/GDSL hydrolase family protein [Planctomycetota bacterium]MDA1214988.1 SGNH/GDSL hydrolase family protein [Planctomycetota bacterium]